MSASEGRPAENEAASQDIAPGMAEVHDQGSAAGATSEIHALLAALGVTGRIRRGSQAPSERARFEHNVEPHGRAAAHLVSAATGGANCWLSVNGFDRDGRANTSNVTEINALSFDLDDKVADRAAVEAFVKVVNDLLGVTPRALVDSGHGLQPHYAVDDALADIGEGYSEVRQRWMAAFRRIHEAVRHLGRDQGMALDVTDGIERLWRAPETTNTKAGMAPVAARLLGVDLDSEPLSLEAIEAAARSVLGEPVAEPARGAQVPAVAVEGVDPGAIRRAQDAALEGIVADLAAVRDLSEGQVDARGKGWTLGVQYAFWRCGSVVAMVGGTLTEREAGEAVMAVCPRGGTLTRDYLKAQWRLQFDKGAEMPDVVPTLEDGSVFASRPQAAILAGEEPEAGATEPAYDPLGVVDLSAHLDGTWVAPRAELLPLADADGAGPLYAGQTHSVFGEPGCGKSWIAIGEAARVLITGGRCAYVDFESSASVIVSRLRALGVPDEALRERLVYAHPEAPFVTWRPAPNGARGMVAHASPGYLALLGESYDFVVLDGVTAALSLFASPSDDGDAYATWHRTVPQKIADRTGAAVLMVDHVTKSTDTRGRFAIGSQSKLALISGAAYRVDVEAPLGPGRAGRLLVKRAKDRHGAVDALVPSEETSTLPTVATWSLDATSERLAVDVRGAVTLVDVDAVSDWADPDIIRDISEYLRSNPHRRSSKKDLEDYFDGRYRQRDVRKTVAHMLRHGSLREDGPPKPRSSTPSLRMIEVGDPMLDTERKVA